MCLFAKAFHEIDNNLEYYQCLLIDKNQCLFRSEVNVVSIDLLVCVFVHDLSSFIFVYVDRSWCRWVKV